MYGVEEATGLGGLMAQAPGGDIYLPSALRIRSGLSGMLAGPNRGVPGDSPLPYNMGPGLGSGGLPQISPDGRAVERPTGHMLGGWREILDFHNSPAPYILLMILLIYGWVHVSYRKGRLAAGGGVR